MKLLRLDIHDALVAIGSSATGLLGNEGKGVAFIQQAQFAFRAFGSRRVKVNAPFEQIAMQITDQRANVARGVWATRRLIEFLAIFDVTLHAFGEMHVVAFVDGIDTAIFWHLNQWV